MCSPNPKVRPEDDENMISARWNDVDNLFGDPSLTFDKCPRLDLHTSIVTEITRSGKVESKKTGNSHSPACRITIDCWFLRFHFARFRQVHLRKMLLIPRRSFWVRYKS